LPDDLREFVTKRPARTREGYGFLKFGYCCSSETPNTVEHSFRVRDRKRTSVRVQITTHPKEYRFVAHDLLGMFLSRARDSNKAQCPAPCTLEEGIACLQSCFHVIERKSSCLINVVAQREPLIGLAGWYHENDKDSVTVLFHYEYIDGLPAQLIDSYLERYPSAMDPQVARCESWIEDDLTKWASLIRSRPAEAMVALQASVGLLRYQLKMGISPITGVRTRQTGSSHRRAAATSRNVRF
jgi:hypothetical protein